MKLVLLTKPFHFGYQLIGLIHLSVWFEMPSRSIRETGRTFYIPQVDFQDSDAVATSEDSRIETKHRELSCEPHEWETGRSSKNQQEIRFGLGVRQIRRG